VSPAVNKLLHASPADKPAAIGYPYFPQNDDLYFFVKYAAVAPTTMAKDIVAPGIMNARPIADQLGTNT
jgi:hypothetical protein